MLLKTECPLLQRRIQRSLYHFKGIWIIRLSLKSGFQLSNPLIQLLLIQTLSETTTLLRPRLTPIGPFPHRFRTTTLLSLRLRQRPTNI